MNTEPKRYTIEEMRDFAEWYRINRGSPKNPSILGMDAIEAWEKSKPLPLHEQPKENMYEWLVQNSAEQTANTSVFNVYYGGCFCTAIIKTRSSAFDTLEVRPTNSSHNIEGKLSGESKFLDFQPVQPKPEHLRPASEQPAKLNDEQPEEVHLIRLSRNKSNFLKSWGNWIDSEWCNMPGWWRLIKEGGGEGDYFRFYSFDKLPESFKERVREIRGGQPANEQKPGFVWTDELVKEYVGTSLADTIQDMGYFKRQHQIPPQPTRETLQKLFAGYKQAKKIGDNAAEKYLNEHPELKGQIPIEPERIEVEIDSMFPTNDGGGYYHFHLSRQVPEEKLLTIKQAIENCLNNERSHEAEFWANNNQGNYDRWKEANYERLALLKEKEKHQQELGTAREEAFYAARLHHPLAGLKFDTFTNYIKSLKP